MAKYWGGFITSHIMNSTIDEGGHQIQLRGHPSAVKKGENFYLFSLFCAFFFLKFYNNRVC